MLLAQIQVIAAEGPNGRFVPSDPKEMRRRGKFPTEEAVSVMLDALQGIAEAHAHGFHEPSRAYLFTCAGVATAVGVVLLEWTRARDEVQPCLDEAGYDPQVFLDFPADFLSYNRKQGGKRLSGLRSAKSVLDKAMRKAKIAEGDYAAAAENPATKRAHARWQRLKAEVAVISQAQIRLRCERLFETREGQGKFKAGDFDGPTTHALAAFEKRNAIMGWGHFNRDNLDMLALSAVDTIHARLERILKQRVSSGAGLLEDGSARDWKPEFRWKDSAGEEHALRDLTGEALEATLTQLGLSEANAA